MGDELMSGLMVEIAAGNAAAVQLERAKDVFDAGLISKAEYREVVTGKKPRRTREQQEQDKIAKAIAKLESLRTEAIDSRLAKAAALILEAQGLYGEAHENRRHQRLADALEAINAYVGADR